MAKNPHWMKNIRKNGSHKGNVKVVEEIENGSFEDKREGKYEHIVYVSYRGSNGSARKRNDTDEIELFVANGQRREIYSYAIRIDEKFFDVYRNKDKSNELYVVGDFIYWEGFGFSRGFYHLEDLDNPKSVVLSSILLTIANSEKYSENKGEITERELSYKLRSVEAKRINENPYSHVRPRRNAFVIHDFYKSGVKVDAYF